MNRNCFDALPTSRLATQTNQREFGMKGSKSLGQRSVRASASVLVMGAAFLFAGVPAVASTTGMNADITTAITGQDFVSYSRDGQPVWAAFNVTITNYAGNNIPNAIFTFTNSLGTAFKVPTIAPNGNASGSCHAQLPANPTTIVCNVATGGSPLSFTLQALSPTTTEDTPAPTSMTINWDVKVGQGEDSNNSGIANQGAGLVNIQAGSTTDLRGYVDATTSLIVVNATGTKTKVTPSQAVTASLKQEVVLYSCSPHYKSCFESTTTIEDGAGFPIQFNPPLDPLFIDLVRDASTIKKGAKIANATLSYFLKIGVDVTGAPVYGTPYVINPCVLLSGDWAIGSGDDRCVVPVTKPANTYTFEDKVTGDWHFQVRGRTNGKIGW
jgi:hypothetical protein